MVVFNGKTGGDLLGELVTDKQYWPALEPQRPVTLTKYTAKADQTSGAYKPVSLGLNPEGDLLPFFKRYSVSLDGDNNGGGFLTLKVTDRVSGDEKFKANTQTPPFNNLYNYTNPNATMANQRLAQVSGHLLLLHAGWWVICYDLSKGAELWKWNVATTGGQAVTDPNTQLTIQNDGNMDRDLTVGVFRYNQTTGQQITDWTFKVGRSAVLQANYAAILTRDGLITKDPRTGAVLWQRAGLVQGAMISGDAKHIFLVEPTQTGNTARVLRAVDGVQIQGVPEFGSLLAGASRVHVFGRQVLLFESGGKDKPRTLRLYDILDGKDVWAKPFPADSALFETIDPEMTGVVSADGKMEVIESRTGKVLLAAAVDEKRQKDHVKDDKGKFNVVKPLLMADADRFYLFLNRDASKMNVNGMQAPEQWGPSPNRVRLVNGPAYAFDRTAGKRLWYTDTQFVNQRLLVERFDELPCLIAFNPMHYDEDAPGGNPAGLGMKRGGGMPGASHRIVVVDKANGALREDKALVANGGGWFQFFSYDSKNGSYELGSYNNARLRIEPLKADAKK